MGSPTVFSKLMNNIALNMPPTCRVGYSGLQNIRLGRVSSILSPSDNLIEALRVMVKLDGNDRVRG
jgi:hypothetical protein